MPELLWSPTVEGDTVGLEITLPSPEALSTFFLIMEEIAHIDVPTESLGYDLKALDCPNHVDVQCRIGSFSSGQERAVARISYIKNNSPRVCSGTLMNVTGDVGQIPYFLTANHCVATDEVARTVEARWLYQRTRCGGSQVTRGSTTSGGADLLMTRVAQDATLLRFKRTLPGGLWLSGWSASAIPHPTRVFGIHHPDGGVKKYATGRTLRNADTRICADVERQIGCFTVRDALKVDWSEGATEGGSSGSGLFRHSDGRLIGMLSGSSGECANKISTYGPFRDFFPAIRRWFRPGTTPGAQPDLVVLTPTVSNERPGAGQAFTLRATVRNQGNGSSPSTTLRYYLSTNAIITELDDPVGSDPVSALSPSGTSSESISVRAPFNDGDYYYGACVDPVSGESYTHNNCSAAVGVTVTATLPPVSHEIPLFKPASSFAQQGFVRIINRSNRSGRVWIHAIDDTGRRRGPIFLDLEARRTQHFNSQDLERGNPAKGLFSGVGNGIGDWRLELATTLDVKAIAYIRTAAGFLTTIHEVVPETSAGSRRYYDVVFFNPARNVNQVSMLRLINPGSSDARVVITAVDDRAAAAPGGEVRLTLRRGAARVLSSRDLERGASGLSGRLGTGSGKWQLTVSADRPIRVMSLMRSSDGLLSNVSGQIGR